MIRVIIFDFDGTLVDSNRIKEDCLHRTVAGISGGEAALAAARCKGGDRYQIFADVAKHLAPAGDPAALAVDARALANLYSQCCLRGIVAAAERCGARQALAQLNQRGMRLWVLSATPRQHLTELLRRRGLYRWLRGSYGTPITKDQGLRRIIAAERAHRHNVLLVGDGLDDRAAANSVGVKFAAIIAERRVDAQGRFAMRDLRQLVPLIDSINCKRLPKK